MRNKAILSFLLAAQLVAAGLVWGYRSQRAETPEPFLQFESGEVDFIEIRDPDRTVVLRRAASESGAASGWSLDGGLPVAASKIDGVLGKLSSATGGWPVATSTATAKRFEVTDENFQRRVVIKAGARTVADLYLGTSPGYRKVHARHAGGSDVYSIEFSNFEAGTDQSSWLDKSLLQPAGELRAVEREGAWSLTRAEEVWTEASGVELDSEATQSLVGRFDGLNVLSVVDAELPASPAMRFTLQDEKGDHQLTFFHLEEPDDYVATSSRVEGVFEIATYIAEQMDVQLSDLQPEPDGPGAQPANADTDVDEAAVDEAADRAEDIAPAVPEA